MKSPLRSVGIVLDDESADVVMLGVVGTWTVTHTRAVEGDEVEGWSVIDPEHNVRHVVAPGKGDMLTAIGLAVEQLLRAFEKRQPNGR